MIKYALITILLITQTATLFAGQFKHLNIKDGLSSRQVFQINQDSEGFIWAFTPLGVDRYDGNEIRHYKLDETLEARDHILSSTMMTVDLSANIWIALKNGKIYTYNRLTDSFNLWADLSELVPAPVILNDILFPDENQILVCLSTGIYSIDMNTRVLTLAGLKGEHVNRIISGENNTFYAGTNTHIYSLKQDRNNGKLSEQHIPLPIEVRTESLYQQGNKLYVGSFSDGVYVVDLTSNTASFLNFVPNVPVRTVIPTKNNTILIATDGAGLYEIDYYTSQLRNLYITNEDDEMSLSGNTVADVFVDSDNCFWVATYTNGISYLDSDNRHIHWIKHEKNNTNSLISNHVNVIFEDSEGDTWYGTNNGVSLHRKATNKWTHFLNDESDDSTYSTVVLALCDDNKGNIWVGGYGIGVYLINKSSGNIRKMRHRQQNSSVGIPTDYIYSIYSEGDYVWLGGIEGEFTRYNTTTGAYTYYPINCIGDMKPGVDNSLLIAGCDGLAIFDKTTGNTVWHRTFAGNTLTYPIRCLLQSRQTGEIWLATDGEGLIRFNPQTESSKIYTTENGLASNAINSLVEDNEGRIWFNTEKELYCFDVQNNKLISMNESMDINWGFYNPNASQRLAGGILSFGTAEGVLTFEPFIDVEEESVKLLLTDFKLLYRSVQAGTEGSLLKQAIDKTEKVKLKYAQNSFSISFSAINFNRPYKIRYEYMLENFNDTWEQSNTIRSIDYMNLSPGHYTFRVKAINKYTSEELDERALEIHIGKPFWASWTAIFMYILLAAIIAFLVIQFMRQRITEYNANEKIRAFINIAHDIRTPITLIKAPLTELQAKDELPEESKKSLSIATKNAEKLFSMVTQLLDLQKAELHPEKLKISQQDIYSYMEEKIADFQMAAQQKGLELSLDIEPGFPEVWFDRDKMNNIIDNLLSNALKYTAEGSVQVTLRHSRKRWSVRVKDTGIGIPEKEQKNLFHQFYRAGNAIDTGESGSGIGLMLTRRVIRLHHGKITFKSIENQGTTFTVVFPQKIKSYIAVKETIKESKKEAAPIATPDEKPDTTKGKNVLLLAEDNDDMREYLADRLSKEYEVISVADGGKALQMAREINPDIIVSDVIMPILHGDELCRILKSSIETSHIPIILLTASSERESIIQGLEAGANDYIIKPFDFSVLKVRIRNILQNRQHLRETVLAAETNLNEIDYSSQLDKEFLDKAMEIIHTELSNPEFSINDFCRMLGMSRTSVYNKIKTLTDQSPNDFMRIIRLNNAKELLHSRKYSISEVSYMVGFSDPKYFSTCFKKQFGISPSKV